MSVRRMEAVARLMAHAVKSPPPRREATSTGTGRGHNAAAAAAVIAVKAAPAIATAISRVERLPRRLTVLDVAPGGFRAAASAGREPGGSRRASPPLSRPFHRIRAATARYAA